MTDNIVEMLVPTVETRKKQKGPAPSIKDLSGKTIGIMDNCWPTYTVLLKKIEELLLARFASSMIVRKTKVTKSMPAPADLIEELAKCDIVINGLCAWGSCTTWCIHDSVQLEDRAVPTVTAVTSPFVAVARATATAGGRPLLPMVELPYRMIYMNDADVLELANGFFDEIIDTAIGRKVPQLHI